MEVTQQEANLIAALIAERNAYPIGFWFSRSQLTRRTNMTLEELCACLDVFAERKWVRIKPAIKGKRKRAYFKLRLRKVRIAMTKAAVNG